MTGKQILHNKLVKMLQDNERPFGLMPIEMREKAKSMDPHEDLMYYSSRGWRACGSNITQYEDYEGVAFRVRSDYKEPEAEVVECEVRVGAMGGLEFDYMHEEGISSTDRYNWQISRACEIPDFIGFDFESMLWGRLYRWKQDGSFHTVIRADRLDQYEVCDMAEAKVLFRGAK